MKDFVNSFSRLGSPSWHSIQRPCQNLLPSFSLQSPLNSSIFLSSRLHYNAKENSQKRIWLQYFKKSSHSALGFGPPFAREPVLCCLDIFYFKKIIRESEGRRWNSPKLNDQRKNSVWQSVSFCCRRQGKLCSSCNDLCLQTESGDAPLARDACAISGSWNPDLLPGGCFKGAASTTALQPSWFDSLHLRGGGLAPRCFLPNEPSGSGH